MATVVAAALAGILTSPLMPAAQAAAGDPFPTGNGIVFVAQGTGASGDGNTRLYTAAQDATGHVAFTAEGGPSDITYNAIALRRSDMYIYAIRTGSVAQGRLMRIGQEGVRVPVGDVTGLPANDYNQGTFGEGVFADTMFVRASSGSNGAVFLVNVDTLTATRLTLSTTVPNVSDIVFKDGYIWGYYGESAQMYRIDPTSGQVTSWSLANLTYQGSKIQTNPYGAQWVYGNGNIGISNNFTGRIYQISITDPGSANPTFAVVSSTTGPSSQKNDGTSYPGEPIDLEIEKGTAPTFQPGPDGGITYTLTVANNSTTRTSTGHAVTDQLPATLVDPQTTTQGCAIADHVLTCAGGPLGPGESTTVTVTATTAAEQTACVTNTATVLGNEADEVMENNTSEAQTCPGAFTVQKQVSAESAAAGDVVTYTVTVTNTGHVAYTQENPASFTDDLTEVLDDAAVTGDVTVSPAGRGSAAISAEGELTWSGPLPVGGTATVTYQVQVADAGAGDDRLVNTVTPGAGGFCASETSCSTLTPVARYHVVKEASAASARPGDQITYSITVTNTGAVDFTDEHPASFTDDLSAVLDDATYNDDADNGAVYTAPVLTWSGPLPAGGDPVTIRYSVTVADPVTGDQLLDNVVSTPQGLGNCADGTEDPACRTSTPVRSFTVAKTVSVTEAEEGDRVGYTITVRNTGPAAFTDEHPASFTDDMTDVLDDAVYNDDATPAVVLDDAELSWSGPVPVGGVVEITYSVTITSPMVGDRTMTNVVLPTGIGTCGVEGCVVVTTVAEPDPVVDPPSAVDPSVSAGPAPVAPAEALAHTGTDVAGFALVGALLVLMGAALTTWRRSLVLGPVPRHSR